MTNGISVNDMVQVKTTGEIGRVVAIDDHTDRLPADLQVEICLQNELLLGEDLYAQIFPFDPHITKLRVDEVMLIPGI